MDDALGITETTIEELCERIIDYRGKTPPKSERGVKLLTAKVIKGGTIDESRLEYIAEDTYDTWMRRGIPQQGDLLLTTEAPLGETAVLRTTERIALAQRVILLRADPAVADQRYLSAAMRSPLVQGRLHARATGTTVLGIKQSELRRVEVPLPSLLVQEKIGGVIAAYDVLIENNTRRIRILEEMAQAIYREWFVEFRYPGHEDVPLVDSDLGPIPQGWKVHPASTVFAVNPRERVAKDQMHPFITMGDLDETGMRCFPSESKAGNSGSKFRNGDTLFARITPCLENGKTGFVACLDDGEVGRGSTEFMVLRGALVGPEFTYLTARSDSFRGNAIKSMSGASGRQRVRKECFDSYMLPTPPNALDSRFHESVEPMFQLVFTLSDSNRRLRYARDLLLPQLISGKIDVSGMEVPGVP